MRSGESAVLLGGSPNLLRLSAGNPSPDQREVTAGFAAQAGWSSGTDTISLASHEFGVLAIPVTPPVAPAITTLRAEVDAGGVAVLGPITPVVTAPAATHCILALDAGSASSPSPVGLHPAVAGRHLPQKGYGWVGAAPQSRDRGRPDPLRRDFVNDVPARTLRIAVPAGNVDAHLLVG